MKILNFFFLIVTASVFKGHAIDDFDAFSKMIYEDRLKPPVVFVPISKPDLPEIPAAPVISIKIKDADDVIDEDIQKLIKERKPFIKLIKSAHYRHSLKRPTGIVLGDSGTLSPFMRIPIICILHPNKHQKFCHQYKSPAEPIFESLEHDDDNGAEKVVISSAPASSSTAASKLKTHDIATVKHRPLTKLIVKSLSNIDKTFSKIIPKDSSTSKEFPRKSHQKIEMDLIGESAVAQKPVNVKKNNKTITSKDENVEELTEDVNAGTKNVVQTKTEASEVMHSQQVTDRNEKIKSVDTKESSSEVEFSSNEKIKSKVVDDESTSKPKIKAPSKVMEKEIVSKEKVKSKVIFTSQNPIKDIKLKAEDTTVTSETMTTANLMSTTELSNETLNQSKKVIPKAKTPLSKDAADASKDATSIPVAQTLASEIQPKTVTTDEPRTPALVTILSKTTSPRPHWHPCINNILTGAIASSGYYIYSHSEALSRQDGIKECGRRNMSLAFITNKNESSLVKRLMEENSTYWIGLSRQANKGPGKGRYLWEDGSDAGIFIGQYVVNADVSKSTNSLMPAFCMLKLQRGKLAVECGTELVHKVALPMCMHRPDKDVELKCPS